MLKHRLTLKLITTCVALSAFGLFSHAHADNFNLGELVNNNIVAPVQEFGKQRGNDWDKGVKRPVEHALTGLNTGLHNGEGVLCDIVTFGHASEKRTQGKPSPCHSDTGPNAVSGSYDGQKAEFKSGTEGSSGEPPQTSVLTTVTAIGGPTVGATLAEIVAPDYPSEVGKKYLFQFAGRSSIVVSKQPRGTPVGSAGADRPRAVAPLWEAANETLMRTSLEAFCSAVVVYLSPKSGYGALLGAAFSIGEMNAAIVSTTRNPSPAYINNMLVANVESMLNSFASMATIALTGPYSGFIVGFPLVVAAHYAAPLVAKLMTDPTGKLAAKSSREPTVPKAPPEPPAKSAGAASPRIIPLEKRLLPRED